MAESSTAPSRITHGAVHVLAYLHEMDASCSEVVRNMTLSESVTYRWLTELADVGIIEGKPVKVNARAVIVYRLKDDELGADAQVVGDRL